MVAALLAAGCGGSSPKGPPALVFVSVKDGDYAIFGADADGEHAYRLTKEKGDPSTANGLFFQVQPAWSPDGQQIAFSSGRDGTPHIFRDERRRNGDRAPHRHGPGGRAAVVVGRRQADRLLPRGCDLRGAGHGRRRPTGSATDWATRRDPAFSPDGKLIAYDYRKPGFSIREIYVMNADGTGIRKVTRLGAVSALPAWSPDGRTLAFQSNAGGPKYEIYTVDLNGGRPRSG